VGERLLRERAICLDLFLDELGLYCFVLDGTGDAFSVRVHLVHELERGPRNEGDLRKAVSSWRGSLREAVQHAPLDYSDLVASGRRLGERLGSMPAFPGLLAPILRGCSARAIYVAPILGLHGIPLHAAKSEDGWSLSDVGPVLQIVKARQLAEPVSSREASVKILAASDSDFAEAAAALADRTGAPVLNPFTREAALSMLRRTTTAVVLGHGMFDKDYPGRSHISLGNGIYLTLRDIRDLELAGTEVVLLSCWAGWAARGKMPKGELEGGPSAWLAAGAGAVLAPLWPVPIKEGAFFIRDFLRARQSQSRADAIQSARREATGEATGYEFGDICAAAFVLWGTSDQRPEVAAGATPA
jgi:hypothetical protein